MGEEDAPGYRDFFEEEDFSKPPVDPESLVSIQGDLHIVRETLPTIHREWEVVNYAKLDVTDLFHSVMLSFRIGKHERPEMLPSIEMYKVRSEEFLDRGHIGDILFFIPDNPNRYVLYEVYSYRIRKRHRILPAVTETGSGDTYLALREMAEMLKREQDSEEMVEETGIDFVSDETAQNLKLVTESFKEYVLSYFRI